MGMDGAIQASRKQRRGLRSRSVVLSAQESDGSDDHGQESVTLRLTGATRANAARWRRWHARLQSRPCRPDPKDLVGPGVVCLRRRTHRSRQHRQGQSRPENAVSK